MITKSDVKIDWLVLLGALLSAGATIISVLGAAETPLLVQGRAGILLLVIVTVVGTPLMFWMPRIQAGRLGRLAGWHVPSRTYLLPRWLVRLCIGAALGQAVGAVPWALWKDPPILWLAGAMLIWGAAFVAGAWRRMVGPRSSEFTLPLPGWHLCQKTLTVWSRAAQVETTAEQVDAAE